MMNSIDENRANLNFQNIAKHEFLFLKNLGFMEVEETSTIISYTKADMVVNIFHGRQSYEIDFEIIFKEIKFSLYDLMRSIDKELVQNYRIPAATTQEGVTNIVKSIAGLVRQYCLIALGGDSKFFSQLEEKRKLWVDEYWLKMKADQLRPKANEAFHNQNYPKAFELFREIESCLTPSELKKMEIAEREMKAS